MADIEWGDPKELGPNPSAEGGFADPRAARFEPSGQTSDPGRRYAETRRPTGMGEPGTLPSDRRGLDRVRQTAGGKLTDAANRIRAFGSQAAEKPLLRGAQPLALGAAEKVEDAAEYVRTRELDEIRGDFEGQVRRHPLGAVAVAFLAGYALRRLF